MLARRWNIGTANKKVARTYESVTSMPLSIRSACEVGISDAKRRDIPGQGLQYSRSFTHLNRIIRTRTDLTY